MEFKDNYEKQIEVRILNQNFLFDLKEAAMNTIRKDASGGIPINPEIFKKYLISEHSPIRSIVLRIKFINMYYPTSVHFARHVHSIPYVTTSRPDRIKKDRNLDNPVTHIFDINIQGLIDMMRKRLCVGCCSKDTYNWAKSLKLKLINSGDEYLKVIGEILVPNCIYRSGCPEFKSCGFYKEDSIEKRYANFILYEK